MEIRNTHGDRDRSHVRGPVRRSHATRRRRQAESPAPASDASKDFDEGAEDASVTFTRPAENEAAQAESAQVDGSATERTAAQPEETGQGRLTRRKKTPLQEQTAAEPATDMVLPFPSDAAETPPASSTRAVPSDRPTRRDTSSTRRPALGGVGGRTTSRGRTPAGRRVDRGSAVRRADVARGEPENARDAVQGARPSTPRPRREKESASGLKADRKGAQPSRTQQTSILRPARRPIRPPASEVLEDTGDDFDRSMDEAADEIDTATEGIARSRRMLINVSGGDECRVAVLHDGRLEELFIERASAQSHVGNIYKGRVTNVEPSIQAVFVDFGLRKDGFLHISDVQPQYFPDHKGHGEDVGRKIPRHLRPPIQRCFRRGQEVMIQVTKEGVGTKGPTLTTYLSIPGRYLVMMPGMNHHGVSRKIEDELARRKMRDVMKELKLPTGMGFILRTAGEDRTKRDLQRDLNYLLRLWRTVADRVRRLPAPAELYRESDLVTRAIRDVYTFDFDRLVVDDAETARRAQEFIQIAMPRAKTRVELYSGREPLFHRFGIEEEIEKINMRHVPLASGGYLVIDTTEALVAIDVNSGKFRSTADVEETAFHINMEAAVEIARQLRLRDLGGLIVCDFIDMRQERHMRAVERALREELKKHKERARILRMSAFGIIEMTRQRQGPSIKRNLYDDCPHCNGTGLVKMPESIMLDVMRTLQLATNHSEVHKVVITVANDVAMQILNSKRAMLTRIESETGKILIIRGEPALTGDQIEIQCEDASGRTVTLTAGSVTQVVGKANGNPTST